MITYRPNVCTCVFTIDADGNPVDFTPCELHAVLTAQEALDSVREIIALLPTEESEGA
jgi:hypothetical protein